MKPWRLVDRSLTPDGKEVSLHEQDGTYTIHIDSAQLMSTRRHSSEERLAELACAHLGGIRRARVLIGGLGFGFTLKAALRAAPADATVVQAEILAAVIAWNRNPEYRLAADAMADPRVVVLERDVADVIRESPRGFDSIILDVDNGPVALSAEDNRRLYDARGLRLARAALRKGGCVAFWSAAANPAFERLMVREGFTVDVETCRAHASSGSRHTLMLGRARATLST